MHVPALASRVALAVLVLPGLVGGSDAPRAASRVAICFAPDTPPDVVARIYANLATRAPGLPPLFQFQDGDRWSVTATNPCCLQQGAPTTITWGVVPDGTPIVPTGSIPTEPSDPSSLRAYLDVIYGDETVWLPLLQQVFDRWGQITGATYVHETSDDGAEIEPFGSNPGQLGVRPDVRIAGHFLDGFSGILAYNYFPEHGDMIIDTGDDFFFDTSGNSLHLRNTVAHEHGHGLGIKHVCPTSQTKLMEPFFSSQYDGPQHDDTLAGNRGYGDDLEDNDTSATATNLGSPGNGTTNVTDVSADDHLDVDFYRFTIVGPKVLTVTMTPVGFTYLQGPQNPNGSCPGGTSFNSLTQNDLGISVLASNGSTVLATQDSAPAGGTETISNLPLSASGNYFVKVFAGAPNKAQLYSLALALSDPTTADLSIGKTDGQATAVPGNPITYTIAVSNAGPLAANGATVTDNVPAALLGASWTCSASAGSSCPAGGSGNINATVNVAVGGTLTFTLQGTISPGATGTLVNTAAVAGPPGIPDPNAANNTATDSDTLTPQANLGVTKTDGQATAVPGLPLTYTITVTSAGPSSAAATVLDTPPAALGGVAWTCSATAGSICALSGSGTIADNVVLAPGGSLTYTMTGTVSSSASGTLSNTATVTPAPGVTDPNAANNSATDSDALTPQADLALTKTDGQATAVPGLPLTYTITVGNPGPSTVPATVTDTPPAALTGVSWTCSAGPSSACAPSGSGPINDAVTVAAASSLTYALSGTVSASATGTLSNTATVTPGPGVTDPNAANNSATDSDTLAPQADLGATKTDSQAVAVPGLPLTYQMTVTSAGPSSVTGATVADTVPAVLSGVTWTCSASAGSSCPASGSGSINHAVDVAPGGTLSYAVTGMVAASATGSLTNTLTVAAPGGVTDPAAGNNAATDTDALTPQADLRVTKSDGQSQATPGGAVTYTIVASNPGPSDAPGSAVADTFPGSISGVTWICTPSGGASCGGPSGSGNIAETVSLPSGSAVTYTASGTIGGGATGTLVNTASVAPAAGVADLEPSNNSATDVDNLTLSDLSELVHGSVRVRSLESQPGPVETRNYYWLTQPPRSSFEVVVDGVTGAISSGSGPDLELLAGDAATVVQGSVPAGAGSSRSLRLENPGAAARSDELVRVQSGGCTTACGPDALYRVRGWDTGYRASRFNNSGTQVTVLVVQNRTSSLVSGHVWFWGAGGTLLGSQAISLQPKGILTLNTSSVVPASSGSLTISHDGPYAGLSGKAVAVEPATGFTFDTPLVPRQR